MIQNIKHIAIIVLLLHVSMSFSQETIDPSTVGSIVTGGGQATTNATLELLEVAIVDVEPESDNTLNMGSIGNFEAGLPASGIGGTTTNEDLWLNFTYRGQDKKTSEIVVYANQKIPKDITIEVQIIAQSSIGGDFIPSQVPNIIEISDIDKIIVDKFPSGYTGDGVGTGYQLRYTVTNPTSISLPPGFDIIYEIK
jgi:hypothetical protein